MIKEREPALERMSVIAQVFWTLVSFYFLLWFEGIVTVDNFLETRDHFVLAIVIIPVWFTMLEMFEMGTMGRMQKYRTILKKYLFLIPIGSFVLFIMIHLFDFNSITGTDLMKFAILDFLVLSIQKIIGRMVIRSFRKKGYNTRMLLLIADETGAPFVRQIIETDDWGYRIWGIITDSDKIKNEFGDKYAIYPENEDFARLIDEKVIDDVFFCKQDFNTHVVRKLVNECREVGVGFHLHNKVLAFGGLDPKLSFLNRQFFLSFRNTPENYIALKIKGAVDFFMATVILILVSPVMLTIGLLIKLEDGGPVFFKQVRVGKHGRLFKCLKFRTMVTNAEDLKEKLMELNEQDGPVFKIKNDPRITKVGKFLRKTSLDELPQFINVLVGDMSIVGPRPPVPSEVKQYKRSLNRRLSVNPGITCTWQVSGRNNIPFDRWMEMDMEYIDNWSLGLDFIIILKTFKVVFSSNGQ
ncbi:exopolysaccharide biosynthesis polyprenyl glycosylphosphotransferase [Maribellus comscasis]|uniref:Exopolysaccharide biosynthesis polyprenyl glycosylphosphotransferase n=1 Tax=Maribellus comscasis TaxID=2681766 RepID=A0A6I6K1Y8_9BACT|nr:sugar transferase [Maribellus comscasis]QGY43914.1 exopolysaccharide biosynthesis polyprenyl glycosylphosphotransferase [Maribellus comscasis]